MNNKTKWLLVLSLATTITGSGIVMAATSADQKTDAKPGHPMCQQMKHGRQNHQAMLDLIKIDEATFRSEIKAGKTLAQMAAEHGVTEQAVIDLAKQHMTERIEEGVKAGRLTAEQAERMKDNMEQRAEQMVKSAPGPRGGFGPGKFGPHFMGNEQKHKELLELLKIDENTLRSEFKAGKTLGQIAVEHGISEQAVIDLKIRHMTERIEEGLKSGRLTAEQAEQMKAGTAQRAEQMVKTGHRMMSGK